MYKHSMNETNWEEIKLKEAIANDEKSRWKRIGIEVGKSEKGCQNKAKALGWSR
jgi:hypothetical protein